MTHSPTLPLTPELSIPQLGFGTWKLRDPRSAIGQALQVGYRHLDTADLYHSHGAIAEALADSGLPRADVFITTKLMPHSHGAKQVKEAVQRFLQELHTDYIDLLLIHWPSSVSVAETLGAMDAARKAGQVRALGVSNFEINLLQASLDTGILFSNNQIEYNLKEQPQGVLRFCLEHGISVTSYTSLERGTPEQEARVAQLTKTHNATREQVLLSWLMHKGMIVIPASSNAAHIESNFQSLQIKLADEDIAYLEKGVRTE